MSIPKEPRQLMINIMYLVLTALLALNVSAEIFNAFEMVDEGLTTANKSLDESNGSKPELIKEAAKKKASLAEYADRLDGLRSLSKEASSYIDEIVDQLIDASGDNNGVKDEGDYVMVLEKRELKGKKSYDGTTRFMVDEGKGDELKDNIMAYKEKFLTFVDSVDRVKLRTELPLTIDEVAWTKSPNKKKGWSDFTFGHMPLGATMPIFTKFKNDVKSSEAAVLNYLAGKVGVGGATVVLDKFTVVSAPRKSYIIKGEKFETDVFLSASAGKDSQTGLSISVNGKSLRPDSDGVAKYVTTANGLGVKKYNAAITVSDPVTGEKKTFKKEFEYEVGQRSVTVSPLKMNVFYIGVDNPVAVSAAGVNSTEVKVSMSGGGMGTIKKAGGNYVVNVKKPTKKDEFAFINVTAPGLTAKSEFRVKRIPSPVPMLSTSRGGAMPAGEFKAQQGVRPVLDGFDFDAKCSITEFVVVRVPKRQDPEPARNSGGKFVGKTTSIVKKATAGDKYFFENIKCKCPGDPAARNIGQMVFNVK
jgi:gliding motility-associated protein GldM